MALQLIVFLNSSTLYVGTSQIIKNFVLHFQALGVKIIINILDFWNNWNNFQKVSLNTLLWNIQIHNVSNVLYIYYSTQNQKYIILTVT